MIVKINRRGHSFKGVVAYLMHDKDAASSERVVWSETGNLFTDDPKQAAKIMAYTDMAAEQLKRESGGSLAGREATSGAVYHYSLSWAHGENPDGEHQKAQAKATLEQLGLENHQYLIVSHNDTKHAHVHVVVNLTDQETGKREIPSYDKRELQDWALQYEQTHGMHCEQREENSRKREQGSPTKYQDERQSYSARVTEAYQRADNGKTFAVALEAHGLTLAQGRRGGLVIVDESGDIQKLARQIDGAKAKDIKARLADLDLETLPNAEELGKQRQTVAIVSNSDTSSLLMPEAVREEGSTPTNIHEFKDAVTDSKQPAAGSLEQFAETVTKTLQANDGELHINDGLTWWQRVSFQLETVRENMMETMKETTKEIVDTVKGMWQEFIERFPASRDGHDRDNSEHER